MTSEEDEAYLVKAMKPTYAEVQILKGGKFLLRTVCHYSVLIIYRCKGMRAEAAQSRLAGLPLDQIPTTSHNPERYLGKCL